jgi:transposase-like protein
MAKNQRKIAQARSQVIADLPAACSDERLAVEFFERQRWGSTPACPRCGDTDVSQMKAKDGQRHPRFLWRCKGCRQQYTVRIGTIFEDSRVPLRHWAYAFWAACAGKKGVSAKQIQRQTGLSYKSALFLMHRIRFAMTDNDPNPPKLTGIVEADETYVGGKPRRLTNKQLRPARARQRREGFARLAPITDKKIPVLALIQRDGEARAMVTPVVNGAVVREFLLANVDLSATLMTDEATAYIRVGKPFAAHESVGHSRHEYARGRAHVNSAESFFARFKRQLHGTHHSVSPKHLHRYVSEVVFKHNTRNMEDGARVTAALNAAEGKRFFYRDQVGR